MTSVSIETDRDKGFPSFTEALTHYKAKLLKHFPETLQGRIEAGAAIARAYPQTMHQDPEGPWHVVDALVTGETCTCADAQTEASSGWCAHRLGALMVTRVLEQLEPPAEAEMPTSETPALSEDQAVPHAPRVLPHEPAFDPNDPWVKAVLIVSDRAHRVLPAESYGRLEAATAIACDRRKIILEHADQYRVAAGKDGYYTVNHTCNCRDVTTKKAPGGFCKHRIAVGLARRAATIPRETLGQEPETFFATSEAPRTPDAFETEDAQEAVPPTIPAEFIVYIQGKPFIQYKGLLAMAHERGLVSLTAKIEQYTPECVLASAVATFQDGQTFAEWADATPQNVTKTIAPHFPRVALTRAKARSLRDALNIGICSVEELA